jgi:hypothetical protein
MWNPISVKFFGLAVDPKSAQSYLVVKTNLQRRTLACRENKMMQLIGTNMQFGK